MKYTLAILTLSASLSAFANDPAVYAQAANCDGYTPPAYGCCQHLANPTVFWVASDKKLVSTNGIKVACFLTNPDFTLDSGPNNCDKNTVIYPTKGKIDTQNCKITQYPLSDYSVDINKNNILMMLKDQ